MQTPEARAFRDALSTFTTGVTIVTTRTSEGIDIGLTANSFNSVSLDPPMVLWSLAKNARSLDVFMNAEHFAVHVLASTQDDLSARFAAASQNRFKDLAVERGRGGIPLLEGCSARFQCRTAFRHDGGDHTIFIGEVEQFDHWDREPLVFHGGRYAVAIRKPAAAADRPADDLEPDSSFSRDFLISLLGRARNQVFLGLRAALGRLGLTEDEWLIISVLGAINHRTIGELDQELAYTGTRVTYELAARLASGGFLTLTGGYDPHARVSLTAQGQQVVMELVAAAKAVEETAERNLGRGEVSLMKSLLRTIIHNTAPASALVRPSAGDE